MSIENYLQQKLNDLKQKNLLRQPKGQWGGDFIDFSSNDYLGLRSHEAMVEAAIGALWQYGAGAGASRLAGGNYPLFDEFEQRIAAFKGYDAACVFGSGYLTNLGVIQALVDDKDAIIVDRLSHACIIDGARLSGAKLLRFKHNNPDHLRQLLLDHRTKFKKVLVVTEEIFSMDGDTAPIAELQKVCAEFDVTLMVDGAHSLYNGNSKPDIYVGTMSKALGSYGGYVCGSKAFIEYIKTSARSLIYSTALPPSAVASAIAALDVIETEKPYERTLENVEYFYSLCHPRLERGSGYPLKAGMTAIIPVILGTEEAAVAAEKYLYENGILASSIRPPTVPNGTSRLRISISALHNKQELEKLAACLKEII
jgi:8-amino-7-oxononanoate synthase